jgi:hypothetical protein
MFGGMHKMVFPPDGERIQNPLYPSGTLDLQLEFVQIVRKQSNVIEDAKSSGIYLEQGFVPELVVAEDDEDKNIISATTPMPNKTASKINNFLYLSQQNIHLTSHE